MAKKSKKVKKEKIMFIMYVDEDNKEVFVTTPKLEAKLLEECFGHKKGRLLFLDELDNKKFRKYCGDEIDEANKDITFFCREALYGSFVSLTSLLNID